MRTVIVFAAALTTVGCATVVRGTKDNAKFESDPAGATVTVEAISSDKLGPFDCKTPCELELKRKREWNVVFTLDGYKPATGILKPKVTGGGVASGAGNVLAGGIIGIGVDAGTGANLDLRPNPMKARLVPIDSGADSYVLTEDQLETEEKAAKSAPASSTPSAVPAASAPSTEPEAPSVDPSAPAEAVPPGDAPTDLTMDPVDGAEDATSTDE